MELSRAILTALAATSEDETLLLQVTIAKGYPPRHVRPHSTDPTQGFLSQLVRGTRPMPSDSARQMTKRGAEPSLDVHIRIAASADSVYRTRDLLRGLTSALHSAEGASSRFYFTGADTRALDDLPYHGRVQLTVSELVGLLGLPLDEEAMPGIPSPHPKLIRPSREAPEGARVFGLSTASGEPVAIGQRIEDAQQHVVVTGPTG